jgi:hypothetical protein
MQDHVWIVERFINGQWVPHATLHSRQSARNFKRTFRAAGMAFRIRKFIAA